MPPVEEFQTIAVIMHTQIQSLTILVDSKEPVVRAEVMGAPDIRVFLSRMHICKLGLTTR